MTDDERQVMINMILLRGFQLYRKPTSKRYALIGDYLYTRDGSRVFECVDMWVTGEVAPSVTRSGFSDRWKSTSWDSVPDKILQGFYRAIS